MRQVTIYSTDYCPYCRMAEKFLVEQHIDFKSIDVTDDDLMREKLVALTGRKTVPQIFIGDQSIGGYSELMTLSENGQLKARLSGHI
jgi:glutaredoxin 3